MCAIVVFRSFLISIMLVFAALPLSVQAQTVPLSAKAEGNSVFLGNEVAQENFI